jgi:hypothetical protein
VGAEYYLFALFVFALVAILAVLFIYGAKRNRAKDEQERKRKEEKLMMMYFEVEDMIDGLKEYVDASREKIETAIKRVETDMQALSTMKESLFALRERSDAYMTPVVLEAHPAEAPQENPEGQLSLFDLNKAGHDVENIAKQMNLSKTEVELMLKFRQISPAEKKRIN